MTLQDDIARYIQLLTPSWPIIECIAAGLERDYYLVKLADLPEVVDAGGNFHADETVVNKDISPVHSGFMVMEAIAIHRAIEARRSEAAALDARRDELAREHWTKLKDVRYSELTSGPQSIIDRVIAAEDEVAKLRGERS